MNNVIPINARQQPVAAEPHGSTQAQADNAPGVGVPGRDVRAIARARVPAVKPAVYTVAEVADLLRLSLGGTYAMVRTGEIPAKRMGGRWVIPRHRFHAWLDDLPEASTEDVARALASKGDTK